MLTHNMQGTGTANAANAAPVAEAVVFGVAYTIVSSWECDHVTKVLLIIFNLLSTWLIDAKSKMWPSKDFDWLFLLIYDNYIHII